MLHLGRLGYASGLSPPKDQLLMRLHAAHCDGDEGTGRLPQPSGRLHQRSTLANQTTSLLAACCTVRR